MGESGPFIAVGGRGQVTVDGAACEPDRTGSGEQVAGRRIVARPSGGFCWRLRHEAIRIHNWVAEAMAGKSGE